MKRLLFFILFACCVCVTKAQVWKSYNSGFTNNGVFDFIEFNNELYAGGTYYSTSSSLDNIARWDGSDWSPLGPGMLGGVYSMAIYNGELHVAGNFSNIPGVSNTKKIARWDGSGWHALHYGITSGTIQAISEYDGSLYVGGNFTSVDSMSIRDVARWNGNAWFPVCTLNTGLSQIFAMTIFNNELYIGGYFGTVNGNPSYNIARFDGTTWNDVGGGLNGDVFVLLPDTINNRLYAAGNFSSATGGTVSCASNIAYWDGNSWHAVGAGPLLYPRALGIYKNEVYAGFVFPRVKANGDTLQFITRWDGNDWQNLGTGLNGSVQAMFVFNSELAVGGYFTQAGDTSASEVAAWDYTPNAIQEIDQNKEEIKISPNPFNNTATVELPKTFKKHFPCFFKLYDVAGKEVIEIKNISSLDFTISKATLNNGVYFYKLFSKNKEIANGRTVISD